MKKLISILMLLISLSAFPDSTVDLESDYNYSLVYHSSGTHQAGLTISLSIKRGSDGYWYDFNDSTFKSSGWTSKTVSLTEDSTNHNYYYTWSSQGGDTTANIYIFHAECSGEFILEETVVYVDLDTSSDVTDILNKVNAIRP